MANRDPINFYNNIKTTANYQDLQQTLIEINSAVTNAQEDIVFDFNGNSPLVNLRKGMQSLFKSKTIKKTEKIGIAVAVLQRENYDTQEIETIIYVDTPESNFVSIQHPDLFSDPTLDLSPFNDMRYYPSREGLLDTDYPSYGDLVLVSYNGGSDREKKYLGIFSKKPKILPLTDGNTLKKLEKKIQLSKEEARKSLFNRQPSLVEPDDILDFPLAGQAIALDIPSLRIHPVYKTLQKNHFAIDFRANKTEVLAPTDIIIVDQGFSETGGNILTAVTKNKKYFLRFMHLDNFLKKVGDSVKRGEKIAISGNTGVGTGPHLHFEINLPGFSISDPKQINSLFLLKGELQVSEAVVQKFNLSTNILTLPLSQGDAIFASNTNFGNDEKQQIPKATKNFGSSTDNATTASRPKNRPKMLLQDFKTDYSNGVRVDKYLGSNKIIIREDLISDMLEIKNILNSYNIPLTCITEDINLTNNKISVFSKVGLEILLNKNAGLTQFNNLDTDDYFISPDYNNRIGNGYKLIVYGNVKRFIKFADLGYKAEKKIIDVYDGRSLSTNGPPKITKILKNVINITKIFEDFGFVQVLPKQEFFLYSDLEGSNWYRFQNLSKIQKGYTYKELLKTVYNDNGELIWKEKDFIWNGEKFI